VIQELNIKAVIAEANEKAVEAISIADPAWIGVAPAIEVVPGMRRNLFLHAGPPITWDRMCSVQQRGILDAIVFEKLASNRELALQMIQAGEIDMEPHHDHAMTAPGGLITSASCFTFVIENRVKGNRVYGLFPPFIPSMGLKIESLTRIIEALGELDLKPVFAEELRLGDDLHSRTDAGCLLFERTIAPTASRVLSPEEAAVLHSGLANFNLFFSLYTIPASKAIMDSAAGIKYSTVVTAMSRNGVEFGIRVSGLGNDWFIAPAPKVEALYLPGFTEKDALEDIGDSAITETAGFGGFSMAAAPSHTLCVGGNAQQALGFTREMYEICLGKHPFYKIPTLDFAGIPIGIDIRKVVQTGILPIINTGVTHKDPDQGPLVGYGSTRAPAACFTQALKSFAKRYNV